MKFLWLLEPDALWTLIPLFSLLFSVGGSGPKSVRRLGIPLFTLLAALSMGANWLGALIASAALLYSLRLGYGENLRAKSGVFYLLLVGMIGTLYGASFIPLGWPVALLFPLIGGITFPALLVASQKLGLPWKVVELIIGAELGAFALFSLLK